MSHHQSVQSPDTTKVAPTFVCPLCQILCIKSSKCLRCNYILPEDSVKIFINSKISKTLTQSTAPDQKINPKNQVLIPPKFVKVGATCPHCRNLSYNISKCEKCNHTLPADTIRVICKFQSSEPSVQLNSSTQNMILRTKAVKVGSLCPHCGIFSYNISKCEQCNHTLPAGNVKIVYNSNNSKTPVQSATCAYTQKLVFPPKSVKVEAGCLCPYCGIMSNNISECEQCRRTLPLEIVSNSKNCESPVQSVPPAPTQNLVLPTKVGALCLHRNNISNCEKCRLKLQADIKIVCNYQNSQPPLQLNPKITGLDQKLISQPVLSSEKVRLGEAKQLCPHCELSLNFSKCQHCNYTLPGIGKSVFNKKYLILRSAQPTVQTQKFSDVKLKQLELPTKSRKVRPVAEALRESIGVKRKKFSTSTEPKVKISVKKTEILAMSDNENKEEKPCIETHPTESGVAPKLDTDFAAMGEPTGQLFVKNSQIPPTSDNKDKQKGKLSAAIQPTMNGIAAEFDTDPSDMEEPISFVGKFSPCSPCEEDSGIEQAMDAPVAYQYILMLCKTLHIGTYKVNSLEKVVLSTKGLVMKVPLPSEQTVLINIPMSDICQFMVSISRTLPALFVRLSPKGGSKVRKALQMNDSNNKSFYYDPASGDDTLRHIILLPENITEDSKMKLKKIVDVSRKIWVEICVGSELKLLEKPAYVVPEIVTLSSDDDD